jgi:hypothetical protein
LQFIGAHGSSALDNHAYNCTDGTHNGYHVRLIKRTTEEADKRSLPAWFAVSRLIICLAFLPMAIRFVTMLTLILPKKFAIMYLATRKFLTEVLSWAILLAAVVATFEVMLYPYFVGCESDKPDSDNGTTASGDQADAIDTTLSFSGGWPWAGISLTYIDVPDFQTWGPHFRECSPDANDWLVTAWVLVGYALVVAYLLITTIVLMNLLIAAMNQRYEELLLQVEKNWLYERVLMITEYRHCSQELSFFPPPLNVIDYLISLFAGRRNSCANLCMRFLDRRVHMKRGRTLHKMHLTATEIARDRAMVESMVLKTGEGETEELPYLDTLLPTQTDEENWRWRLQTKEAVGTKVAVRHMPEYVPMMAGRPQSSPFSWYGHRDAVNMWFEGKIIKAAVDGKAAVHIKIVGATPDANKILCKHVMSADIAPLGQRQVQPQWLPANEMLFKILRSIDYHMLEANESVIKQEEEKLAAQQATPGVEMDTEGRPKGGQKAAHRASFAGDAPFAGGAPFAGVSRSDTAVCKGVGSFGSAGGGTCSAEKRVPDKTAEGVEHVGSLHTVAGGAGGGPHTVQWSGETAAGVAGVQQLHGEIQQVRQEMLQAIHRQEQLEQRLALNHERTMTKISDMLESMMVAQGRSSAPSSSSMLVERDGEAKEEEEEQQGGQRARSSRAAAHSPAGASPLSQQCMSKEKELQLKVDRLTARVDCLAGSLTGKLDQLIANTSAAPASA